MSYIKVNNNYKSLDGLMKEIFNEFPSAVSKAVREDVLHYPPVNITDKIALYLVELSAPGYEKADFSIKLDNNVLTVSTEKKEEAAVENEKLIRIEFGLKSFKRSFTLNEKIDTENITARYENGILKIELQKKESFNTSAKDINIL
ncbi:MAG: Hsp20/alpha crystallin family protein [Ferruginibacter sp.]|nr:Hsp20/alpha crystallin family protein [Ferruginibacter sp.]